MRSFIKYLFILIITWYNIQVKATGDSTGVLTHRDTIFIQHDIVIGTYFKHLVAPKQTMYSLCRFYGIKPEQLMIINPALQVRLLQTGESIRVPISRKVIRIEPLPADRTKVTPVYYKVVSGDGLFRISKNYFNIPHDKLMKINGMTGTSLNEGQLLLIGWVPLKLYEVAANPAKPATAPPKRNIKSNPTPPDPAAAPTSKKVDPAMVRDETKTATIKDKANNEDAISEAADKAVLEEKKTNTILTNKDRYDDMATNRSKSFDQGAAFWHKNLKGSKGLYVLHRKAATGTIVAVTNPMFNNTVYARVAGNIPANVYPDDIRIIVSPEVARLLGARDAKFFVKVGYFRK